LVRNGDECFRGLEIDHQTTGVITVTKLPQPLPGVSVLCV
jgi:hypothetical protein